jgi:Tol biopolymer transport system component
MRYSNSLLPTLLITTAGFGLAACDGDTPTDPSAPIAAKSIPVPSRKLAFTTTRDGDGEVYAMNANGTGQVNLTSNPGESDYRPAWSPNGKKIAFLRGFHLFIMNGDGTGLQDLTGAAGFLPSAQPVWSPDGSTILFSMGPSQGPSGLDVWRVHPDGSGLVNVTADGLFNGDAGWSPDGSRIVYIRNTSDGVSQTEDRGIYSIAPDGTGRIQLTASERDSKPAWSPNGSQIAFTRSTGPGADDEIFVMNTNGGSVTNITNDPADDELPVWSPDGSKILFLSPRSGSWQLYTMGATGNNLSQLTATDHTGPGVWSPDGAYIAFTRRPEAGNKFSVWTMTASGDDETVVSTGGNNSDLTWKGMR